MKKLYVIFLLSLVSGSLLTQSKTAYSSASEASKAITTLFASVLRTNFLVEGISADKKGNWDTVFNGVARYVEERVNRTPGMTKPNRDFLDNTRKTLSSTGDKFIRTVTALRNANSQFKKTEYGTIDIDAVQKEVSALMLEAKNLKTLEDKINAAPDSGNKATEDTKDVLHKLTLNLRLILEKLGSDFQKIAPDIRKAVAAKKHQQSLNKSVAASSEFQRLSDELVNAANVFAVANVFEQGIAANDELKWKATINKIGDYIKSNLEKQRSVGQKISDSNKKLIKDGWAKISPLYTQLPNLIKEARKSHAEFKAIAGLTYAKVDRISERVSDFIYQAQDIPTLRKNLKPSLVSKVSDVLDSKNMKNLEDKVLGILDEFIKKMKKDWCAVLSKVSGPKAPGSASAKLCGK